MGDAVDALAVRHVAREVHRRERRIATVGGALGILLAGSISFVGLAALPPGFGALLVVGRALGRGRRARAVAAATEDDELDWSITRSGVIGRDPAGRRADLILPVPARLMGAMRALPAARVVQATSSMPPATDR